MIVPLAKWLACAGHFLFVYLGNRRAPAQIILNGLARIAGVRKAVRYHSCARKESAAVVRKTVRCHQSNRFFALCHIAASCHSHKAFPQSSE